MRWLEVRTAAPADLPVEVASTLAVVSNHHLDPPATVGAVLELAVGVECHKGQGLAVVIDSLAWRHSTPTEWLTHGSEPRSIASLAATHTAQHQ